VKLEKLAETASGGISY